MLSLLWILEISMLDTIYQYIKTDSIKAIGNHIIEVIDTTTAFELDRYINSRASDTDVCVFIYDEDGAILHRNSKGKQCSSPDTNTFLERIHLAYENNSIYIDEVKTNEILNLNGVEIPLRSYNEIQYTHTFNKKGHTYHLLMNSSITPMDATVSTLRTILFIVTVGMSLIALVLGYFISKKIINPLKLLTEQAKFLGQKEVEFKASGYDEVEELSQTLTTANKGLQQVEQVRNELISNISHDLRTPLTMISGYAEMMRDLPEENNEENLNIIIEETQYLNRLVNDVLDLSKLQSGAKTLTKTTFNLTQMVQEIIKRVANLSDIRIIYEPSEDIEVIADEMKISQVFYNMLNNALHYTTERKEVIVRQIVSEETVRIEIQDFGEGIDESEVDDIWKCYYRSKNHQRQVSGSGLGLYIVKQILDLHHATYGVTSKLHEGSCFYFELKRTK